MNLVSTGSSTYSTFCGLRLLVFTVQLSVQNGITSLPALINRCLLYTTMFHYPVFCGINCAFWSCTVSLSQFINVQTYFFMSHRSLFTSFLTASNKMDFSSNSLVLMFHRKAVKATLVLVPLFGLHFGITMYRPQSGTCQWQELYVYLDILLDGLQGAVVALIFCYINGEVLFCFENY